MKVGHLSDYIDIIYGDFITLFFSFHLKNNISQMVERPLK